MGQNVSGEPTGPDAVRVFTRALLRDLQALEQMLGQGMIESGVRRIVAEQEMFLVNRGWRPAPIATEVLDRLGDPFTTELALFNSEANVEPRLLEGRCFSTMEARLNELVQLAREAASHSDGDVALVGILPTLTKTDLSLDNITPRARYYALNEALSKMRGGEPYKLRIEGTDELYIEHDSVMVEACNTSCQVHLQVEADEFARFYNVVQAASPRRLPRVSSYGRGRMDCRGRWRCDTATMWTPRTDSGWRRGIRTSRRSHVTRSRRRTRVGKYAWPSRGGS